MHGGGSGFEPPRLHLRMHLDNLMGRWKSAHPGPTGWVKWRTRRLSLACPARRRAPSTSTRLSRCPGGERGGLDGRHRSWCDRNDGHTVDALALDADEGRGHATKCSGEALAAGDPEISEWGNPAGVMACHPELTGGEPGELKHLSTPRNREDALSSGERTGQSPNRRGVVSVRALPWRGCTIQRELLARSSLGQTDVRRRVLERHTAEGESPVVDGAPSPVLWTREYRPTRDIGWEAGGTTSQG